MRVMSEQANKRTNPMVLIKVDDNLANKPARPMI